MKRTQKQRVIDQLVEHGRISRNWCLRNYISRLAALVAVLKDDGWELIGKDEDGDYVYVVVNAPTKKVAAPVQLADGSVRYQTKEVPLFSL